LVPVVWLVLYQACSQYFLKVPDSHILDLVAICCLRQCRRLKPQFETQASRTSRARVGCKLLLQSRMDCCKAFRRSYERHSHLNVYFRATQNADRAKRVQLTDGVYTCLMVNCRQNFTDANQCCDHMVEKHCKRDGNMYSCTLFDCRNEHATKGGCARHMRTAHGLEEWLPQCGQCHRYFTRPDYLKRDHKCGRSLC
jgi:hypothetical protein